MKLQALLLQFTMEARNVEEEDLPDLVSSYAPKVKACPEMDSLLSEKQVAEAFPAIPRLMLRHLRQVGKGPKYIKTGEHKNSRLFYWRSDVEKWLESFDRI